MRVSLSRWTFVCVLGMGFVLGGASGCRTTGNSLTGWSTPSWMTASNWSWPGKSSTPSAVAQAKPSTSPARPSAGATPQAVASVAAPSAAGQTQGTNPSYAAAAGANVNPYGNYSA